MRLSVLTISFATAASALLAVAAFPSAGHAQGWDPNYPVCLDVFGRGGGYRECSYTSLPQCQASASGRAAECVVNPFYAAAYEEPGVRVYRHHRRHRPHHTRREH